MWYLSGMEAVQQYLKETFGEIVRPVPAKDKTTNLPLFLRSNYELFVADLAGNRIILVKLKAETGLTPIQLKKQAEQLSQYLKAPIVFVFNALDSWQRKRLIEKKIGFAEPYQQLFIPELLLQIKDGRRITSRFMPGADKLKSAAQCLLLYHLQTGSLGNKSFQEIASLLHYSPMTVTRAVKELVAFQLVTIKGNKEKSLQFDGGGKQLWEKALPHLDSPVRETWLSDEDISHEQCRISGDTALAAYTMLADTDQKCMAIGKDAFRQLKDRQPFKKLNKNHGEYKLEVWHYDPFLLSRTSEVDRLSLYLSMRNEHDERVQGALHNLINEIKW